MKLYYFGHEIVSQPSYPRVREDQSLKFLKVKMASLVLRYSLSGLSAPQMGVPIQFAVVKLSSGTILDLVNPKIVDMVGSESDAMETCISCPPRDNGCKVMRMNEISLVASNTDRVMDEHLYTFKGVDARAIQHEVDHLSGTFFFDRAQLKDKYDVLRRFREWKHDWKTNNLKEEVWQP